MLYGFVVGVHLISCVLLIVIVLIQSGRGGGLTDNFSSMEALFGTKTNSFLTRTTAALAALFIITCLSLTFMATKRSKSLIEQSPQKAIENNATSTVQDTKPNKPQDALVPVPESTEPPVN